MSDEAPDTRAHDDDEHVADVPDEQLDDVAGGVSPPGAERAGGVAIGPVALTGDDPGN